MSPFTQLLFIAEPRAVHYSDLGGIEAVLADIRELVEHPLRHPEASHFSKSLLITRHCIDLHVSEPVPALHRWQRGSQDISATCGSGP